MTTFLNFESQTDDDTDEKDTNQLKGDFFFESGYSADVEDSSGESSDVESSDSERYIPTTSKGYNKGIPRGHFY